MIDILGHAIILQAKILVDIPALPNKYVQNSNL